MSNHNRVRQVIEYFLETGDGVALDYLTKKFGRLGLSQIIMSMEN